MSLPGVDWIAFWHIYHTFLFWAYMFFSFLIRLWLARSTRPAWWVKTWLVRGAASLLVVPVAPFICIPAWIVVFSLMGRTVADSSS